VQATATRAAHSHPASSPRRAARSLADDERFGRFIERVREGWTLAQIGRAENPTLTRERVRQIFAARGYTRELLHLYQALHRAPQRVRDELAARTAALLPEVDLWRNVGEHQSGCWLWQGPQGGATPASVQIGSARHPVRRYVFERFHGPSDGRRIHATCGDDRCVSPDHLYLTGQDKDEDWFLTNVQEQPATGCWIWTGPRHPAGYGRFSWTSGETVYAHRYAYERFLGAIPAGWRVVQTCSNPACCSPDHLIATDKHPRSRAIPRDPSRRDPAAISASRGRPNPARLERYLDRLRAGASAAQIAREEGRSYASIVQFLIAHGHTAKSVSEAAQSPPIAGGGGLAVSLQAYS
jgi:hypothetical protein